MFNQGNSDFIGLMTTLISQYRIIKKKCADGLQILGSHVRMNRNNLLIVRCGS